MAFAFCALNWADSTVAAWDLQFDAFHFFGGSAATAPPSWEIKRGVSSSLGVLYFRTGLVPQLRIKCVSGLRPIPPPIPPPPPPVLPPRYDEEGLRIVAGRWVPEPEGDWANPAAFTYGLRGWWPGGGFGGVWVDGPSSRNVAGVPTRVVAIPWWFLTLVFAITPARLNARRAVAALADVWPSRGWRAARARAWHRAKTCCPGCGYDLRTSPGPCPECGRAAGEARPARAWVTRRSLRRKGGRGARLLASGRRLAAGGLRAAVVVVPLVCFANWAWSTSGVWEFRLLSRWVLWHDQRLDFVSCTGICSQSGSLVVGRIERDEWRPEFRDGKPDGAPLRDYWSYGPDFHFAFDSERGADRTLWWDAWPRRADADRRFVQGAGFGLAWEPDRGPLVPASRGLAVPWWFLTVLASVPAVRRLVAWAVRSLRGRAGAQPRAGSDSTDVGGGCHGLVLKAVVGVRGARGPRP